ncbi:MAG: hypothetical protein WCF57_23585 [Pyrinomonadaceae bacterium]
MLIRVYVFLLSCLLVAAAIGCATNSAVKELQQSTSPQQAPSPQQPAQAGASNVAGEQQQTVKAETGAAKVQTDACSLITKSEIEAVQGEPVKETKGSNHASGSFAVSRCFYTLASFNKSVSLEVTLPNTAKTNQPGPKEFWESTFHKKEAKEEREKEEDKERAGKGEREEEEEGGGEARPVPGVGDEAFWSGNRKAGALYVLKNNAFIRISIGGSGDESAKIDKSKALAQKAIGRL